MEVKQRQKQQQQVAVEVKQQLQQQQQAAVEVKQQRQQEVTGTTGTANLPSQTGGPPQQPKNDFQ